MQKKIKSAIVKIGLFTIDKKFINGLIWIFVVSTATLYYVIDREKLVLYVISFAVNQVLIFLLFSAGLIAIVNIYIAKKIPSIFDEILIRNNADYFRGGAYIFQVLRQWENDLYQKPFGFNSVGKELLIRDFIITEIKYLDYNLVILAENIISNLDDERYCTSKDICNQFREILITRRLRFSDRFGEAFANKITIDPEADLKLGRKKDILRVVPHVLLQKYTNSCSNFNIFLDNCISQVAREEWNRHDTLLALYSDLVKAVYAYKDNILPNFGKEFNGDLSQYHLLYNNVPLVPIQKHKNWSKHEKRNNY
jgi:hypothetical protein